MFQETTANHASDRTSPAIAVPSRKSADSDDPVRLLMFGPLPCVRLEIHRLHVLGYAEATAWSKPLPTDQPNEVMVILTKRCRLAEGV
ncbi:hypothetical protein [Sphaerothrix gracilis]|uniref:hypothetical protein n=1 Tax=Sphaerothrix gracilis TaxID=3151835 RepID=UPI0031FC7B69